MSLCAFYQGRLAFICLCDSDGEANIAIDFYHEKLRHLTDSGTALRVYTVAHELFSFVLSTCFYGWVDNWI